MKQSVIIIGAGIAGLAAARALTGRGVVPLILEARDRVGGRIWTVSLEREPVDLGASWIHGKRGNPIARLAKKLRLPLEATDWSKLWFPLPGEAVEQAEQALARTEWLYTRRGRLSVAEVIPAAWKDDALMQWALRTMITGEYGADPSGLSLQHWRDDEDFEGSDFLLTRGYGELVTYLAEGLEIRVGQVVQAIRTNRDRVVIETVNGVFDAEYAILTLPLGVLKQGSVFFDPRLPDNKQRAIERLGLGVLNKLVLVFERPFWPQGTQVIGHRGAYSFFIVRDRMLVGLVGGEAARLEVPEALENVLRGLGAPRPLACVATNWHDDPFARGAVSVVAPGGTSKDFEALRAPVDRLLFAGEATSRAHRGTVHGAYLTGRRAGLALSSRLSHTLPRARHNHG